MEDQSCILTELVSNGEGLAASPACVIGAGGPALGVADGERGGGGRGGAAGQDDEQSCENGRRSHDKGQL